MDGFEDIVMEPAEQPGGAWEIHVARRRGSPPLRFSGRRLCHHTADAGGDEIHLSLWVLRQGGFVVAHSLLCDDAMDCAAHRAETLDQAMTVVETYCAELCGGRAARIEIDGRRSESIVEALNRLHRRAVRSDAFLRLAGDALAAWDEMGLAVPDMPTKTGV